jgi:hypothetical protein
MAEIFTLVTSIDPLAPYKVSNDLLLELVNVTTNVLRRGSVGFRLWNPTNWSNTNRRLDICSKTAMSK